jgi:hypothetical protein
MTKTLATGRMRRPTTENIIFRPATLFHTLDEDFIAIIICFRKLRVARGG